MDENEQHPGATHDADAAHAEVTPLFDDEATQVARPVVPLTAEAAAVASVAPPIGALREDVVTVVNGQTSFASAPVVSARRSWLLGLIAASVLVGSVLGGVGLRFYQKRQATKAAEASTQQTQAPAAVLVEETTAAQQQPADAPTEATTEPQESASQTIEVSSEAPATFVEENPEAKPSEPAQAAAAADDDDARPQVVPARKAKQNPAEPREANDDDKAREPVRRERRDGRVVDDRPRGEVRERRVTDPESDYIEREARRIRRLERQRARRERTVDSLHGIFEGRP